MRSLLPLAAVLLMGLLAGCGGGAAATMAGSPGTNAPGTSAPTTGSTATEAPPSGAAATDAPSAATTTVLPAACAEGLGKFLVAIEPLVATFDPAKHTLGALYKADDAAGDKAYALLQANNSTAPYSCSEVGLEWAYFDADTPWDAVLVVAGDTAPGTVGYLNALRDTAALDVATLADFGIDGCDAAVGSIKKDVKALTKQKVAGIDKMDFQTAVDLLGRYSAYMREVQDEKCPRDELGNDEFDFMARAR